MGIGIYVLGVILAPIVYFIIVVGPWLLKLRKIYKSVEPFNVDKENDHWLKGHLPIHPGPNQAGIEKYVQWVRENPKLFYIHFPMKPNLVLCHPDTLKVVLKSSEPKGLIPAAGWSYWIFNPWLGEGLLSSNGSKWSRSRRLLTPGFHFDVLKPYMEIFNTCVEGFMTNIADASQDGSSVEVFSPVSLCTLSVMLKCAFSYNDDVQVQGQSSPYVKTVNDMAKMTVDRMFKPYLYLDAVYYRTNQGKQFLNKCEYSHVVCRNVIRKRREALRSNTGIPQKKFVDFLDILLLARDETGKGLTDQEILDEVETFMFEGHDTTASGVSWILYNLSRHPEIQAKARAEVDKVMLNKSQLDWDDMTNIPYLAMCIKESLRLHPPVVSVSRELTKPTTFCGHTVATGTTTDLSIYGVHHNEEVWGPDHMTYDPERFQPDNIAKMDSYAFIPFSAGPRNCIGQVFAMNEIKTTIARILHRYELVVDESHNVEMQPELILRAKDGIKIYFKERQ